MKKQLVTMMTLMTAMTLFSATASAQSVNDEAATERLDFNPVLQAAGASVGAGAGIVGGTFAGGLAAALVCDVSVSYACNDVIIGSAVAGAALGGMSGALVGVGALGGNHATSEETARAIGGAAAGMLLSVPMVYGVTALVQTQTNDTDTALYVGIATASVMTGLGASLGYQSSYDASGVTDVTIAPMVGEHKGLVLSGRF